ncbi:hypothetical protein TeGR_g3421 [Tetraparma gracilis]|uniref:HMA domain-containing protein n=1 Tax=Tetraparma gracilis TaxID=2962635 RepID=A0ABQ6NDZ8_9STRA|nr:hypothetical protein TeGR_g3421 [Tetraparma gracilis]
MYASSTGSSVSTSGSVTPLHPPTGKPLYLVTDRGFLAKFLASLSSLLFLALLPTPLRSSLKISPPPILTYPLSFLASSCCLLQVLLNALSVGCAGFNAVLGPARPVLLAAAALLQYLAWKTRPSPAAAVATLLLALSPELLWSGGMWRSRTGRATPAFVLDLGDAMGCASCVTTVKRVVEKNAGVRACDMAGNTARVFLREGEQQEKVQGELAAALTASGFPPTNAHT